MPRQENIFNVDPFGRPLQPDTQSVISPYHPDNNRPHNNERNSSYTYRQRNMKLNLTLGWELEANHVPSKFPAGVEHIQDGSVNGHGAEFVVLPSVTKSPRYVLGLLKDLVHAPKLNTDDSCGFHVHVSASNLSSAARMKQWAIATEHLASLVEDLAFKAVPDSRRGNSYCKRIVPITNGATFQSHKYNNDRRYHWLNIVEMFRPGGIRTIEVRLLGHTHRWKYLLAWSLFSMELARRGWDISNKPFEVTPHVDALSRILINIEKEIKPLNKKHEPIPQWVYDGLKTFGIESNAWNRPLARLAETETDLRGLVRMPYSDDQPEEEMPSNDDECPCGCGEEGRCLSRLHEDSECDNNYCEYCHSNGDCGGSPDCESCHLNRHDEGEDCGRRSCVTCHPAPRVNRPIAPIVDPIDMNGVTTGRMTLNGSNVTFHTSNVPEARRGLTIDSMRQAVERLRAAPIEIDTQHLQHLAYTMVHDNMMYGTGIAPMVWASETIDDSIWHVPAVSPAIDEERAGYHMFDAHEEALTAERERNQARGL